MDFDIEMDDAVDVAPIPEAYTTDIIPAEEQVGQIPTLF